MFAMLDPHHITRLTACTASAHGTRTKGGRSVPELAAVDAALVGTS
jgi:hypothetical protein